MLSKICASTAALILSASVAFANPSQSTDRKDLQVLKDVATNVQRYTRFTIFDDVERRCRGEGRGQLGRRAKRVATALHEQHRPAHVR